MVFKCPLLIIQYLNKIMMNGFKFLVIFFLCSVSLLLTQIINFMSSTKSHQLSHDEKKWPDSILFIRQIYIQTAKKCIVQDLGLRDVNIITAVISLFGF